MLQTPRTSTSARTARSASTVAAPTSACASLCNRPPGIATSRRGCSESASAIGAGAAQDDVVAGHRVAGASLDAPERSLVLVVLERLDLAAVLADEVVM